ncbi:MAG TPA: SUMF1/EgtB/PvdO family nonheme iron enzyme, partial [Candidatus Syntrophosphaera sp.]|nr:SUMF1/EgtB/PvdO family nonheme iron enzyme [Candidatus Syntrophosphaera sp.]
AYTILETLHKSHRYSIYKAKNYFSGQLVTIKTNVQRLRPDQILVQQMQSEAETGLRLQHPNIRRTLSIFSDDTAIFIVSEFVEGVSLSSLLNTPKLDISQEHAHLWSQQLLDALKHAHALQITHYNLNPSHILITPAADAMLFGFGKSPSEWKYAEADEGPQHPVLFAAPELFLGQPVDARVDIYSWGVLAYLMFCRQLPWSVDRHDSPTFQKQKTFQRPIIDPELLGTRLPRYLFTILNKCLMLDPAKRFADVHQLQEALDSQLELPYESCLVPAAEPVPPTLFRDEIPPDLPAEPVIEELPSQEPEPQSAETPLEREFETPPPALEPMPESGMDELLQPDIFNLEPEPRPEPKPGPQPQPTPQPRISTPPPTRFSKTAEPVVAPAGTPPPVRRHVTSPKIKTPDKEVDSLRRLFRILKFASLAIVVYILFKYVIIRHEPKFSKLTETEELQSAAEEITVKNEALPMIAIPGGKAVIGHLAPEAEEDEFPPREVTLAPFLIGAQELTRKQWAMATPGYVVAANEEDLPVVNVTYYDVIEYCNEKSRKDGFTPCYEFMGESVVCDFSANGYRLPTEAEWEFAAREARRDQFKTFSGSDSPDEVGWYNGNSNGSIQPVASKEPNELGIYDMSGNAAEWVWNWYLRYSLATDISHTGPDSGTDKVVRGGSWKQDAREMRVTNRSYAKPLIQRDYIGFRLARTNK